MREKQQQQQQPIKSIKIQMIDGAFYGLSGLTMDEGSDGKAPFR